jgi:hypothetical protein
LAVLGHVDQSHPGCVGHRIGFGERHFEFLVLTTVM